MNDDRLQIWLLFVSLAAMITGLGTLFIAAHIDSLPGIFTGVGIGFAGAIAFVIHEIRRY